MIFPNRPESVKLAGPGDEMSPNASGLVAEWSCSGLQSRVRRFDSDPGLHLQDDAPARRRMRTHVLAGACTISDATVRWPDASRCAHRASSWTMATHIIWIFPDRSRDMGADTRVDLGRQIRAPRGSTLNCRSWLTEAAYRMIQNNLDGEVAENPSELVVYGGIGRAARDWASYDAILDTLKRLGDDQTLLVQSCFRRIRTRHGC
jgi:hypothetical protein